MAFLFLGLAGILGIVSLVCFILIIVKMFQNDDSTLGIICIVTIFCGIGGLIAFVMGWINAGKYGASQLMLIWTGAIVGSVVLNIIGSALAGGDMAP
ncbi:hypothetical protein C5Y96_25135 [Blastopirellula marina]|uniref:Uncharacterized protein n=1 Tax=Blastopirellula marina TaxID=124 RepID=A0A2S8EZ59_9BACT|nr:MULTISPECIES: hypothetical protein [Pirellulaceae]PQO25193.1 hypothetical protein C5Y96_25135 [Blastopirellula marina]RCS41626.1 hypothetical protein DTL36_25185 [Bremerella cremea]